jgi:hypothetical protein
MASWEGLRSHVKANFNIAVDELDYMALDFHMENGRGQRVGLRKMVVGDEEWAEIATVVCTESDISPRDALLLNGKMAVGGLAMWDDGTVVFRHSLPLLNLDTNEFMAPLKLAVEFGDQLEGQITGGDRY